MTKKRPGPAPGVHLTEVSVKRELTVQGVLKFSLVCRVENQQTQPTYWWEASALTHHYARPAQNGQGAISINNNDTEDNFIGFHNYIITVY